MKHIVWVEVWSHLVRELLGSFQQFVGNSNENISTLKKFSVTHKNRTWTDQNHGWLCWLRNFILWVIFLTIFNVAIYSIFCVRFKLSFSPYFNLWRFEKGCSFRKKFHSGEFGLLTMRRRKTSVLFIIWIMRVIKIANSNKISVESIKNWENSPFLMMWQFPTLNPEFKALILIF